MIVPDHWAEAKQSIKHDGKSITVRRFGWSNESEDDAHKMAEARVAEAIERIKSGEKLAKREPKVPYNGADGVPIREEVLSRHDEEVISRNSYGAHCLNTPRALFADIDFDKEVPCGLTLTVWIVLAIGGLSTGFIWFDWKTALMLVVVAAIFAYGIAKLLMNTYIILNGGINAMSRKRIRRFIAEHAGWGARLYKTPNGLRLLATHRPFAANEPEVDVLFKAIGVDPIYSRMCKKQACFRARLTAKPWRIGIPHHMRPRPGTWPVNSERMPLRTAWVNEYDKKAEGYASCQFDSTIGKEDIHEDIAPIVELHDQRCRALDDSLEIA